MIWRHKLDDGTWGHGQQFQLAGKVEQLHGLTARCSLCGQYTKFFIVTARGECHDCGTIFPYVPYVINSTIPAPANDPVPKCPGCKHYRNTFIKGEYKTMPELEEEMKTVERELKKTKAREFKESKETTNTFDLSSLRQRLQNGKNLE